MTDFDKLVLNKELDMIYESNIVDEKTVKSLRNSVDQGEEVVKLIINKHRNERIRRIVNRETLSKK